MNRLLMKLKLRTRLFLSFVVVILLIGFLSIFLGVSLIQRSLPQVQDVLAVDLGAAREIYRQQVAQISDAVRLTARQIFVRDKVKKEDWEGLAASLETIRQSDDLDMFLLTDLHGNVLLRVRNPENKESAAAIRMVAEKVLQQRKEYASAVVFSGVELEHESPELAARARIEVVSTTYARAASESDQGAGMVILAGAPVMSEAGNILGVLCGGQLLNRQATVVDRILRNLYGAEQYQGHDVAIAAVFLGDKRIATSFTNPSGERAVGTLATEEVYDHVLSGGSRWVKRSYVINDWYLTAYEPILDPGGKAIGMLGLGLLERKFNESEQRAARLFLALTLVALALAALISYLLSNHIMKPVNSLIAGTEKIAGGASLQEIPLDTSPQEIGALGSAFNRMLRAIRDRDQQLRRQTQEKLVRSDRLAMIGQLAAGVAHEINNPLGSILLFSRLCMQQVPQDGRVRENLERIEKETKRCHTIVRSLLDFARQREPQVQAVPVNELMDATLKLFENQFLFHNIEIVKDYRPDLPSIPADQAQLQQVLMNIILNAADAMGGKGRLTIATRESDDAASVEISITDTGCGIPPENINRIFDPFFTTKGVGHGTGLGLSVSYGIIQKHNGDLSVSSTPGEGSTFTISLPKRAEARH